MSNRDEVQGMAKGRRGRIADMMKNRFLGGGPVEPPTIEVTAATPHFTKADYSAAEQRIILAHGEKALGVSTYEAGPLMEVAQGIWGEPKAGVMHLPDQQAMYEFTDGGWLAYQVITGYDRVGEMGLTWVGWLEKYAYYVRDGDTPIFQQTVLEELTMADAKAQGTWFGDEPFMDEGYYSNHDNWEARATGKGHWIEDAEGI